MANTITLTLEDYNKLLRDSDRLEEILDALTTPDEISKYNVERFQNSSCDSLYIESVRLMENLSPATRKIFKERIEKNIAPIIEQTGGVFEYSFTTYSNTFGSIRGSLDQED